MERKKERDAFQLKKHFVFTFISRLISFISKAQPDN